MQQYHYVIESGQLADRFPDKLLHQNVTQSKRPGCSRFAPQIPDKSSICGGQVADTKPDTRNAIISVRYENRTKSGQPGLSDFPETGKIGHPYVVGMSDLDRRDLSGFLERALSRRS